MQTLKSGKFFYGWVVVAVTAVTLFVSAGMRSASAESCSAQMKFTQITVNFSEAVQGVDASINVLLLAAAGAQRRYFPAAQAAAIFADHRAVAFHRSRHHRR